MLKTHFTRKNLIAIAMTFFYGLSVLIAGLAIDGNNPFFVKNNPIQNMAAAMFPVKEVNGITAKGVPAGSVPAYILLVLFVIYVVLCTASIIYEVRLAKYYDEKPTSMKWWIVYVATFLISGALWTGISMVSQISDKPYGYYIANSYLFLLESIVLGFIVFVVLGSIIFNLCLLVVNFKNIDKPFKFFDSSKEEEKEEKAAEEEKRIAEEQGKLAESFGEGQVNSSTGVGGNGNGTVSGTASLESDTSSPLKEKERVFPGLCSIDYANMTLPNDSFEDDLELNEICVRFRNYLAAKEGLYFSLLYIQEFIASLAASRFIILEGLSGTGKSSIARYFSEFISEKSYFEAVQATWRDRTSILGYYNDFSKVYNETEFLKRLYDATYKKNHLNVMVLDEVNISRVEYYFADFLSIMEYPVDEWKIKIMQFPYDFDAPIHLQDGIIQIPENTYFIGTANKDESTYTITDKVYDRAISIEFFDRNEPFEVDGNSEKITLSYARLQELFATAISDENAQLSLEEYQRFKTLTDYTYDAFDLTFGNRVLRQMQLFVPSFVKCGGKKEEALDFLFSKKIVSKLEGRFEDYVKEGLINLKSLIAKTYGPGAFPQSNALIDKLLRKL